MMFFGVGLGTTNQSGEWIEAHFPLPVEVTEPKLMEKIVGKVRKIDVPEVINPKDTSYLPLIEILETQLEPRVRANSMIFRNLLSNGKGKFLFFILTKDKQLTSVIEAYFKLQLISHRLVKPGKLNLENIFKVLPNLAWTNRGPVDVNDLSAFQWQCRRDNAALEVKAVDKFPYMADYVVPSGVRIADSSRVRLGAYLGSGTTVMQEGFVNFDAGCEGPNMIEGRVSSGVWVKKNADVGGGASIMGTLSGGGKQKIVVGENCLIGANAGLGIPLGDRCTIEAGLYLTAGTKVSVFNKSQELLDVVPARNLAFTNDILFRRNSQTGKVESIVQGQYIKLNPDLHQGQ